MPVMTTMLITRMIATMMTMHMYDDDPQDGDRYICHAVNEDDDHDDGDDDYHACW